MTAEEILAAVAPVAKKLLPTSATPVEQALLAVEIASLAEVDADTISAIWNPHTCPAILLPWLAWSLSVDVWDDTWDEQTKRSVVAAAPAVHRRKGTRRAVSLALESFDIEAEIIEWWQAEPVGRKGTFEVRFIFRNGGQAFDPGRIDAAVAMVRAAKPKSRPFSVATELAASGTLGFAGLPVQELGVVVQPFAWEGTEIDAGFSFGGMSTHFFDIVIGVS